MCSSCKVQKKVFLEQIRKIESRDRYKSNPNIYVRKPKFEPKKKVSLDTLAQLDHLDEKTTFQKDHNLKKRAQSKWITNQILYPLIDLKSELYSSYWDTYHCCKELTTSRVGVSKNEVQVKAKYYCKKRWCVVCNRIRTGILLNKYKPHLDEIETRLVTLTTYKTKTCHTKQDLADLVAEMKYKYSIIWRRVKRRYGTLTALRKLEVTYNHRNDHFHPHFHVILENNSDVAEYLVTQWNKEFPNNSLEAQDIGDVTPNSMMELFKYFTKMWDVKEGSKKLVLPYPPQKMDDIFSVLQNKRIFQFYGVRIPNVDVEDFDTNEATIIVSDIQSEHMFTTSTWEWVQNMQTWINSDTEVLLTLNILDTLKIENKGVP